jgi:hypothetical protein
MKTLTIHMSHDLYDMVCDAANAEHTCVENFIIHATEKFIMRNNVMSDNEMDEILHNRTFIRNLKASLKDIEKGNYRIL